MRKSRLTCVLLCIVFSMGYAQQREKESSKINKSKKEWKAQLSEASYCVLIKGETERAFTGKYYKHYEKGMYRCAGCNQELFSSASKFDSKSGWPAFDSAIEGSLTFQVDYKIGVPRTELRCSNCGGHLGHVFNDGPQETTGLRHCINSAALQFEPSTNE